MRITREYCDICKIDITNNIHTKSISFTPQFFIRQSKFDVCTKCADKVRQYISFLADEQPAEIRERKEEYENQN